MFGGRKALLIQLRFWVQAFSGHAAPTTSTHLTLKSCPAVLPSGEALSAWGTQGANTLLTGLPGCVCTKPTLQRHRQSPSSSHSKGSRDAELGSGLLLRAFFLSLSARSPTHLLGDAALDRQRYQPVLTTSLPWDTARSPAFSSTGTIQPSPAGFTSLCSVPSMPG